MPHVVTQSCCSDASCVYACPVNCIHPTPDEPDFLTAEMLHIDPTTCVDCGACITACPVDAIVPHSKLTPAATPFLSINADFYKTPLDYPLLAPMVTSTRARSDLGGLRVAVVGSGPAAMYAADEVLKQPGARVNVFDRLPVPYGLVRAGVAPDHQHTKQVTALFDKITREPGFEFFLNVEVGEHVSHRELLEYHHAVVYAVGASSDRRLDVPGAELPGVASATEFVGWYNVHPDHVHREFDLSHPRVVIVGNGNVALDVARILVTDPKLLAGTDIASAALTALTHSRVEEVVIVGRRTLAQAAFTVPELAGLLAHDDFDVLVDRAVQPPDGERPPIVGDPAPELEQKLTLLAGLRDSTDSKEGRRRIIFRSQLFTTEIQGTSRVEAVAFARPPAEDGSGRDERVTVDTGLVLTSIGYHGRPVAEMPFDHRAGIVPNRAGRVVSADGAAPGSGAYVAGWIKRGPSGFIGTNKSCAHETIEALIADFNDGDLPRPTGTQRDLAALLRRRQHGVVDRAGWSTIDAAERRRGAAQGRVRDKVTDPAEATAIATEGETKRARRSRRRGHPPNTGDRSR